MISTIGYCTNVHAGTDLDTIRDNLQRYAVDVHRNLTGDAPLGVGLWLPQKAASQLAASDEEMREFRAFLDQRHLEAFTINGFPYDNFHQDIVKHQVYEPAWWDPRRLVYTKQLAHVMTSLLPESQKVGSISTLPIGWPTDSIHLGLAKSKELDLAGTQLRDLADFLAALEARSGRRIVVAIEPEPGCILDSATDLIQWFEKQLPNSVHRRYIQVCHDICHSAVMMEPQQEVLSRYAAAGIGIGKVQVSSAVVADWDSMAIHRRQEAIEQLAQFAEDRYLHQTGRMAADGSFTLVEDLPQLLSQTPTSGDPAQASGDPAQGDMRWVVHFHVPIFLERFGRLSTSQSEILKCLKALHDDAALATPTIDFTGHFEIETYAWTVLPEAMRKRGLADDVATEIRWLNKEWIDSM
ncbi:hypothetical protein CA13_12150 [Planctomycetes bacterium CA13]|uniref:Xylose isomerase-like TIM barrel n=1 Tax=Novipirellula herctigrandis TaxID=2527986 RepID=A0A5C5YXL1_9BACT|nr:hypothetical protein CA13_12150 [Planctomycetes bacterium CA13]